MWQWSPDTQAHFFSSMILPIDIEDKNNNFSQNMCEYTFFCQHAVLQERMYAWEIGLKVVKWQ